MKSWKAWLLIAVIFATGALAGAFGMRAYLARNLPQMLASSRQSMDERIMEHLDREVQLNAAQKAAILPIVRQAVARGEKVHEAVRGNFDGIMQEMDDRIAGELDAGQRVKFAKFRARMEQLRREGPRPGGPPPGFGPGPGGPPPGPPDSGGPPPGFQPGPGVAPPGK